MYKYSVCVFTRIDQDRFPRFSPTYGFFLAAAPHFSRRSDFFTHSSEPSEPKFMKGVGVAKSPVAGKVGLMAVCKPFLSPVVLSSPGEFMSTPTLLKPPAAPPTTIIYLSLIPPLMILVSHCWGLKLNRIDLCITYQYDSW